MHKENFTAILPVTCNANCSFCPEKEMKNKATKDDWISSLMEHLQITRFFHTHVSFSGGEPSLDPRLLGRAIKTVSRFSRMGCGITTNGQFLETLAKTNAFMEACMVDGRDFFPYFINISRHAFDTAQNNRLMEVNYRHSMEDIFAFRKMVPRHVSFRLNMVLVEGEDHKALFEEALGFLQEFTDYKIVIAFRTDYRIVVSKEEGLIPKQIYDDFVSVFGPTTETYSCPTCITHSPDNYSQYILKAGDFEPTDKEELKREFVLHQDGKLYHDWKRNKPVDMAQLREDREELVLKRAKDGYGLVFLLEDWKMDWLSESGRDRLLKILEAREREEAARPRYTGPGCGGGCGSRGCGDSGQEPIEHELSGCGGFDPSPSKSSGGCGGGSSGGFGCGGGTYTPRRDDRSQSNCGGVNGFPPTDPGPEWTGCSGHRQPRC